MRTANYDMKNGTRVVELYDGHGFQVVPRLESFAGIKPQAEITDLNGQTMIEPVQPGAFIRRRFRRLRLRLEPDSGTFLIQINVTDNEGENLSPTGSGIRTIQAVTGYAATSEGTLPLAATVYTDKAILEGTPPASRPLNYPEYYESPAPAGPIEVYADASGWVSSIEEAASYETSMADTIDCNVWVTGNPSGAPLLFQVLACDTSDNGIPIASLLLTVGNPDFGFIQLNRNGVFHTDSGVEVVGWIPKFIKFKVSGEGGSTSLGWRFDVFARQPHGLAERT